MSYREAVEQAIIRESILAVKAERGRIWLSNMRGQLPARKLNSIEMDHLRLKRQREHLEGLGVKRTCYAGHYNHNPYYPYSCEVNVKRQKIGFAGWLRDKLVGRKGCQCGRCTGPRKQARRKLVEDVQMSCLSLLLS